jgi:hypothetical protein
VSKKKKHGFMLSNLIATHVQVMIDTRRVVPISWMKLRQVKHLLMDVVLVISVIAVSVLRVHFLNIHWFHVVAAWLPLQNILTINKIVSVTRASTLTVVTTSSVTVVEMVYQVFVKHATSVKMAYMSGNSAQASRIPSVQRVSRYKRAQIHPAIS